MKGGILLKEITYKDYYKYKNTFDKFISFTINEEGEEYNYELEIDIKSKNHINNKHDKLFRDLLADKEEVAKLLNKFFKFRKEVISSELEQYNSSFITRKYQNQEADIVYKIKNRNIFFLIEHQSYVDYSMSYRILNYGIEIIRNAIDIEKLQNYDYKYPKVIPIVIYTGNRKWNSVIEYEMLEDKVIGYDEKDINAKYNLIDINIYNKNELLESTSILSKALAIEKCKSKQELIETLQYIVENLEYEKDKSKMRRIIKYIVSQIIGEEETKKLLQKLENKEEVIGMLSENLMKEKMEIIRRAKIDGKKEGRKEGKVKALSIVIKNMLQEKEPVEKIKKYLQISDEEYEKLKNQN